MKPTTQYIAGSPVHRFVGNAHGHIFQETREIMQRSGSNVLGPGSRIAVLGAGYIGMAAARACAAAGAAVIGQMYHTRSDHRFARTDSFEFSA